MIKKWSSFLLKYASMKSIALGFMLVLPFTAIVFPLLSLRFEQLSGGKPALDTIFAYTPAQALTSMQAYGDSGRAFYLGMEWTANLAYPILYSLLLSLVLVFLTEKIISLPALRFLKLTPLLLLGVSVCENVFISLLILTFPLQSPVIATLAAGVSFLKWGCMALALVSVVISIGFVIINLITSEKNKEIN